VVRAAIYARVSTQQQADKDLSIPDQLERLREYANDREWVVAGEYVDPGESGTSDQRPQFQRMVADAKSSPRPFDIVLVWRFSRFSRDYEDSVMYKALLRKRLGIDIVSIAEPVEDSPVGRVTERMLQVFDAFFVDTLRVEVKRGMRKAASLGRWLGRRPYGYRVVEGRLEVDKDEARIVRMIFRWCINGRSANQIAQDLNARGISTADGNRWYRNGVLKILRSKTYLGVRKWSDVRMQKNHKALIDLKTYNAAQGALASRTSHRIHPRRVRSPFPFTGLAYCGVCGGHLIGKSFVCENPKRRTYRYYGCVNRYRYHTCDAKPIPYERLDTIVLAGIKGLLSARVLREVQEGYLERAREIAAAQTTEIGPIQRELAELKRRKKRLLEAIETGSVALRHVGVRIDELEASIQATSSRLRALKAKSEASPSRKWSGIESRLRNLRREFQKADAYNRRQLMAEVVDAIRVYPDRVDVAWHEPWASKNFTEDL